MMGNPVFVDTMNAMGGSGVMMSFSELYSALQTGVVDGAENNPPSLLTQNHYQVTKFYSLTGHLIIPEIFVFSRRTWETMSKEDQDLIKKFSREAQLEQRALWDTMVADSVDKKPFYEATKPVREKYGAKHAALIKRMEDTR
jgi:TRAP-type C4-dicarboxylate transport system substrate-binding protein